VTAHPEHYVHGLLRARYLFRRTDMPFTRPNVESRYFGAVEKTPVNAGAREIGRGLGVTGLAQEDRRRSQDARFDRPFG